MAATTTTQSGESRGKESIMDFSSVQAGCLPTGTVTAFGAIVSTSYTAYEVEGGTWVPFHKVHGAYAPATPLVTFG